LPDARQEGRHVLRRCGKGSVLRVGPEAGEAFLKRQDLSRFGVLHLAAHAVADEANPEVSAVLLAADTAGEDGRLEVDEISRLDLSGSLVALSSCRSASGALVGGEGVMSLSRAFFAAGSAAVLGSLWPLRDDDAEAFFEVFYDRLNAGESAAAAFSAAQRKRLRDGAPAEAWAGFVLSGDGNWRLPPAPESANATWPAALAVGLLIVVAAFFWMRRRLK
jgi:CHAT domain-containing protein